MSEDIQINPNEKKNTDFKNLILNYKGMIISILSIFLIILFSYFFYKDHKNDVKLRISEEYNSAIINYENKNPNLSISYMKKLIDSKDSTYSPLALYFLLDNDLLKNKSDINKYFDILIYETKLDKEVKNLIIYKKGLYNSNSASEEEILNIFKPLINSENIWKSHTLYIIAEYYYSKNEMKKSKDFFEKILEMEKSNPKIKIEAQKRLQRDFSA